MRFMIMVRATRASEAGMRPGQTLMEAMEVFHVELAKAGVLLDAAGLRPSDEGWRVEHSGGRRTVLDGPFAETKELIAGYTMIQVRSREEALEWSRRFPSPFGEDDGTIEVRQLFEPEDFEPGGYFDRKARA
ncbi:YciI family protein [Burkholderia gladioli]|uniref:YciI family protein n=1 Tax=Burkholderia gladioli TaxID=28095 RepID=UPI000F52F725|nr:YciI family protein [Burkholderia gladioli]